MYATSIFAGFFVYAIGYNLIGFMAADIMHSLGMTLSQSGQLLSFHQIGSLIALLSSFVLFNRLNHRNILRLGYTVMIVALIAVPLSTNATGIFIAYVLYGMGAFMTDSGSNILLTDEYFEKRSSYLPLLHFSYSIGAIITGYVLLPFKGSSWRMGYVFVAFLLALVLVGGFVFKPKRREIHQAQQEQEGPSPWVLLKDSAYLIYTAVMILYMGSQVLCATWIPVYIDLELNLGKTMVASALMAFWLGTAFCRLIIGPLLTRGLSPYLVLGGGNALSGLALVLLTLTPNSVLILLFTGLCGFFAGSTIPLFMVVVPTWYPHNTSFIARTYILGGILGRMAFPYLASRIAEATSLAYSLRLSSFLLFLAAALVVIVYSKAKNR